MNNKIKIPGYIFIVIGVFVLWFISKYKSIYEGEIEVVVTWENVPEQVTVMDQSKNVSFNAYAEERGFTLLWHKLFPLELPLDYGKSVFTRNDSVFFNPKASADLFTRKSIGFDFTELPDVDLAIEITYVDVKKIPIKRDFEILSIDNYTIIQDLGFKPDSVTIFGEKSDLVNISQILISSDDIFVTDTLSSHEFRLTNYLPDFEVKPNSATYTLRARQLTEGKYNIPVVLLNKPDKALVKIIPDHIDLVYTAAIDEFDSIKFDDFSIVIDFYDLKESNTTQIPKLNIKNTSVINARLSTEAVQVIIIE